MMLLLIVWHLFLCLWLFCFTRFLTSITRSHVAIPPADLQG